MIALFLSGLCDRERVYGGQAGWLHFLSGLCDRELRDAERGVSMSFLSGICDRELLHHHLALRY